jgi:hypothetical protein
MLTSKPFKRRKKAAPNLLAKNLRKYEVFSLLLLFIHFLDHTLLGELFYILFNLFGISLNSCLFSYSPTKYLF